MRLSAGLLAIVAADIHANHPQIHTTVLHRFPGEHSIKRMEVTSHGSLMQRGKSISPQRRHWLSAMAERSALVSERQFTTLKRHKQARSQAQRKSSVSVEDDDEAPHATLSLQNLRDSEYVGPIRVGSAPGTSFAETDFQEVNVVFDTGSTNLWIASTLCQQRSCRSRHQYDPSQSATYVEDSEGNYLDVHFGTGELKGYLAQDQFHVGPLTVQNQTFAMIEEEVGDVFKVIPFEGILGLAFPSMSVNNVPPLLDNIISQQILQHNEVSFFFTKLPETASAIFFGGVDKRFYEAPIRLFPVVDQFYWTVTLDKLTVGEKVVNEVPGGLFSPAQKIDKLVVDTGTTFFTAPSTVIDSLLEQLPQSMPCQEVGKLPDITYTLVNAQGQKHDMVVPPAVYMVSDGASRVCEPAFMEIDVPEEHGPAFLLGEVFMRHYYTVFDRRDGQSAYVGFAKAKHDKDAMLELENGGVGSGTVNGHEHFTG
mmetsp:Transcript_40968/g.98323  ORF Transcript_40968/g.98323 Transcript_40968/m.98323 type:complete len:481 (+) Transcript_40968:73-1515(+)